MLEAVEDPEDCVGAGGLGTVPDIEGVSDDSTVLAGEGNEEEVEARAAEVLALGALVFGIGMAVGIFEEAGVDLVVGVSLAGSAVG